MTVTSSMDMNPEVESQPPAVTFKKRSRQLWRKRNTVQRVSSPDGTGRSSSDSEEDLGEIVRKRKITSKITASSEGRRVPEEEELHTSRSQALPYLQDETTPPPLSDGQNSQNSGHIPAEHGKTPTDTQKPSTNKATQFSTVSRSSQQRMGPVKAPTNVRTTITTDYQPDVCKDYKQTGFCGFGDGCKFLHARENYKQGWALDREWEIQTRGKQPGGTIVSSAGGAAESHGETDKDDGQLEKIPFKCIICLGDYKNPLVTQCGHYFCEHCALQRYKKHPSCAACGFNTRGVFNVAKNLQKMLDRKRKREERLNGPG